MSGASAAWLVVAAGLATTVIGCSGKNTIERITETAGSSNGDASGSGSVAGSGAEFSVGGTFAGASATAQGGGSAAGSNASSCVLASDCALAPTRCATVGCVSGACTLQDLPKGTELAPHSPPDCHASACDGSGQEIAVLALNNAPLSSDPCLIGVCDGSGAPSTTSAPAGTACSNNGKWCDGSGQCVPCLSAMDCPVGRACSMHQCIATCSSCGTCADQKRDGDETDIDCGGSCTPCADAKQCNIDQDCTSDDCDPLTFICLPASCIDGTRDGHESDVDCGGSVCPGCFDGLNCAVNADCATGQCDALRHTCEGDVCADHRQDGTESDVDCGGSDCAPCKAGQKCQTGFDCTGGEQCDSAVSPHVCSQ